MMIMSPTDNSALWHLPLDFRSIIINSGKDKERETECGGQQKQILLGKS